MYVRNLPDPSGGDTANVIQNGYGFLPDQWTFFLNNQGFSEGSTASGIQNGILEFKTQSNGYQAAFANLSDGVDWQTSDPSIMDFSPTGNSSVVTHWHTPGTVKVTVTRSGCPSAPLGSGGASNTTLSKVVAHLTMTSPIPSGGSDTFSSIQISPYNSGSLTIPASGQQRSFHLLGFTTGGGVMDLTTKASWQAWDPASNQALDPNVAVFSTSFPGSLQFGAAGGHHTIQVRATYQNQVYQAQFVD